MGFMRIFGVPGVILGGLGVDRFGARRVISLSFFGTAAFIILFTQLEFGILVYPVLFIIGVFMAIQVPAGNPYIAQLVPVRHRGMIYSVYFTINVGWSAVAPFDY